MFWTVVYLLIIYKGFKDHTCGMPLPCICANITWEFLFTFIMPFNPMQQIVTFVWFLLDCIILLQFIYYSKKSCPPRILYATICTLSAIALLLHYGIAVEFHDSMGVYTAFGINLLMSLLFIRMLMVKQLRGQSLSIACLKMIGTLCASLYCYSLYPHSILLIIMAVIIFILDIAYIILVYRAQKRGFSRSPLFTWFPFGL